MRLAVAAVVERPGAAGRVGLGAGRRSCRSWTCRRRRRRVRRGSCGSSAPGVPASGRFGGGVEARARAVGRRRGPARRAAPGGRAVVAEARVVEIAEAACTAPSPRRSRRGSPRRVARSEGRSPGPMQECWPCSSAKVSPIASPVAASGAVPVPSFWSRPWPNSCRKMSGNLARVVAPEAGRDAHEDQRVPVRALPEGVAGGRDVHVQRGTAPRLPSTPFSQSLSGKVDARLLVDQVQVVEACCAPRACRRPLRSSDRCRAGTARVAGAQSVFVLSGGLGSDVPRSMLPGRARRRPRSAPQASDDPEVLAVERGRGRRPRPAGSRRRPPSWCSSRRRSTSRRRS